jgi:hypothetical protein
MVPHRSFFGSKLEVGILKMNAVHELNSDCSKSSKYLHSRLTKVPFISGEYQVQPISARLYLETTPQG